MLSTVAPRLLRHRPGGLEMTASTVGGFKPKLLLWSLMCSAAWLALMHGVLTWHGAAYAFWTGLILPLPLVLVVVGFHTWRRMCPLAAVSQLPRALGLGGKRRAPDWLSERAISLQVG